MSNNRARLIESAQRTAQHSGLKGLSFRSLAEEIGIKSSSVHYHFPEKSDLAQALIEQYRSHLFDRLNSIGNSEQSLKQKLIDFVEVFEAVGSDDRICLCAMLAAELAQLSEANQRLLAEVFMDMEQWLADLYRAHVSEVGIDMDAQSLAQATLSGLEGALLIDRVTSNSQRLMAQKALILAQLD